MFDDFVPVYVTEIKSNRSRPYENELCGTPADLRANSLQYVLVHKSDLHSFVPVLLGIRLTRRAHNPFEGYGIPKMVFLIFMRTLSVSGSFTRDCFN